MKSSSIRSFGIGLFLAGAIVQLQSFTDKEEITSTHMIEKEAYEQSQAELKNVKQQLAQLQIDLENAQNQSSNPTLENPNQEEAVQNGAKQSILIIQSGMTPSEIGEILERTGIIQNKLDFEDYIVTQKLAGKIQIGEYELDSSMTIKEITEKITRK